MPITARYVVLKVHLYLGLVAALFLLILSATGTVMAFEHDIERWLNPKLWVVTVGQRQLPEDELIGIAQRTFSPARRRSRSDIAACGCRSSHANDRSRGCLYQPLDRKR